MPSNNRPVWIIIAVMGAALLLLNLPGGWRSGAPDRWPAAVTIRPGVEGGEPGQGLEGPRDDQQVRRWLIDREIQADADQRRERLVKLAVGGGISVIILFGAGFIVLRKGSPAPDRNWAFGTIGAILGYWLGR